MRNRSGEGRGAQQYEKVFPRRWWDPRWWRKHARRSVVFQRRDRRAIWGTSLKSLLAAWPPPRVAIEPTFKPGSIEKPILRCRANLRNFPISPFFRVIPGSWKFDPADISKGARFFAKVFPKLHVCFFITRTLCSIDLAKLIPSSDKMLSTLSKTVFQRIKICF